MPAAQKPRPTNHFKLTIGGREAVGMFREVSGLDSEQEVVEQKHADAKGNPYTVKVPGNVKWSNVELKRGIDTDQTLWAWRHQVEMEGPDAARTDCTLELIDYDGQPIVTYTLLQAWPSKYTGVAMNAGANEVAVESVTLAHEGFKRM